MILNWVFHYLLKQSCITSALLSACYGLFSSTREERIPSVPDATWKQAYCIYIHPVSIQSIQVVFILGLNPVPSISIYLGSNVIDIVNLLGLLSLSLSLSLSRSKRFWMEQTTGYKTKSFLCAQTICNMLPRTTKKRHAPFQFDGCYFSAAATATSTAIFCTTPTSCS